MLCNYVATLSSRFDSCGNRLYLNCWPILFLCVSFGGLGQSSTGSVLQSGPLEPEKLCGGRFRVPPHPCRRCWPSDHGYLCRPTPCVPSRTLSLVQANGPRQPHAITQCLDVLPSDI